ncbi:MAG: alpha/beta hydrolase [Candidatus Latescibacteria bacterium]|jgi:pimeloyl-ACP methyl ester carboxylesterase|nr:alpha/beta hydrolase [Candidatus Latescibacterota bacterium]
MKTYVREDGVNIRYVDKSDGVAVFLAHGQNGNHTSYDPQIPALVGAGYRAIALDRIGRGESETGATRFTSTTEARDYWRLLDSVGVERAVLVGHSSGAGLVKTMHLMQPERAIALVSLDSATFGKVSDRPPVTLEPDAPLDSGLSPRFDEETVALYHRNKVSLQKVTRLWDYPSDTNTRRLVERVGPKAANEERWSKLPIDPDAPELSEPDSDKWCEVPLLVITAGRGRVGPDDPEVARMRARVPAEDATVLVVKNSGHWIHWEAEEAVNRELLAFLDRVKPE